MPTIIRFGNVLIRMYGEDHAPPHFHVVTPDGEAAVRIADLVVFRGRIDRRSLDIALSWAAGNKDRLLEEWSRLSEK